MLHQRATQSLGLPRFSVCSGESVQHGCNMARDKWGGREGRSTRTSLSSSVFRLARGIFIAVIRRKLLYQSLTGEARHLEKVLC